MPVIRFVREGRDIECYPGENLREVALREGIQLYGLKGALGNAAAAASASPALWPFRRAPLPRC